MPLPLQGLSCRPVDRGVEFYQLLQEQGTDFYTLLEKSRAKLLSESEDKAFGRICALQRDVIQWGHETPDPNVVPEDQEAVRAVIAEFRREPSSQPKLKRSLGDDDQWDNIEFHFYLWCNALPRQTPRKMGTAFLVQLDFLSVVCQAHSPDSLVASGWHTGNASAPQPGSFTPLRCTTNLKHR